MKQIINQLSEIEEAAQKIMDDANLQKKEIAGKMKEKTRLFDLETDEKTEAALRNTSKELKEQVEKELARMQHTTEKIMSEMVKEYDTRHTALAEEVLQKIIEA